MFVKCRFVWCFDTCFSTRAARRAARRAAGFLFNIGLGCWGFVGDVFGLFGLFWCLVSFVEIGLGFVVWYNVVFIVVFVKLMSFKFLFVSASNRVVLFGEMELNFMVFLILLLVVIFVFFYGLFLIWCLSKMYLYLFDVLESVKSLGCSFELASFINWMCLYCIVLL